ncbi:hypothetical protein GGI12_006130 [Dipsacomyces acuminosporus]|nr:hypothetical protein GGI12_006130 [Dipsacomyces acuminosporus]
MISLPDAIGWTSIQRLKLEFYIDMGSLYTVLAQMPKLRHLQFCMPTAYLNRLYTENAGANEQARQQLSVANKCVEYLGFESDDHLPKSCLRYALSSILPLVPSLLKLKVNWNSVDDIRDMISDPDSLPGSVSQQLEIVCY